MEVENIVGQLKMVAEKEGIEYEEAALNVIAQKADGGMRDSLSIFDQVTSFSNGKITYESVLRCLNVLDYEYYFKMTDFLLGHKVSDAMLLFNEVVGKGFDGGLFISGLASHFRDLLVSRNPETTELLDVAGNIRQQYAEQAQRCAPKFLYRAIRTCDRCANGYKTSCNKRLSVEITLIEVAQIDTPDDLDGACGLGPTKPLKPIFKATNPQPQAVQVTPATAQPKHEAVANRPVTDNTPTAPAANPQKAEAPTQPAEKPKPAAPRTPIDPALIMQQLGGISIRPLTQSVAVPEPKPIAEPTPAVPEEKDDAPIANTPISKPALDNAWAQISSTQEDPVLRGRMQAMEFRFEAPSTIHLVVHNEGARKLFQEAIPSLRQQFARTLNNQLLSIDLIIEEVKDDYIIEDDATRLVRMLKTHPGLVDLYKDLSLVLD